MQTTKVNTVKKPSGDYFYTYIPSEIAQKLGLNSSNDHIMWNTFGSIVQITVLPLDIARKILLQKQQSKKNPEKIFSKNTESEVSDLL